MLNPGVRHGICDVLSHAAKDEESLRSLRIRISPIRGNRHTLRQGKVTNWLP
jgi:hypothetical protein